MLDSFNLKPVDGLTATSTKLPVKTILAFDRKVIFSPSSIWSNSPVKLPVGSLVKFNLVTPGGKSVVDTEVIGYL